MRCPAQLWKRPWALEVGESEGEKKKYGETQKKRELQRKRRTQKEKEETETQK